MNESQNGSKNGPSNIRLGIVCPMASEEETAIPFVDTVLEQCRSRDFQSVTFFAILDNACKDKTRELLQQHARQKSQLSVIWAPENRGVVDAYLRGYREALAAECDWILEIDAGFSHQPDDIPQFFEKMAEGYDCVFGSRFCNGGQIYDSSLKRNLISRSGTLLANLLLGTRLKDMTSGFEMFSRPALEGVLDRGIRSHGPFVQTEIKTYCRNLKVAEVPIRYRGASHKIDSKAIKDALAGLWRLFRLRHQGQL